MNDYFLTIEWLLNDKTFDCKIDNNLHNIKQLHVFLHTLGITLFLKKSCYAIEFLRKIRHSRVMQTKETPISVKHCYWITSKTLLRAQACIWMKKHSDDECLRFCLCGSLSVRWCVRHTQRHPSERKARTYLWLRFSQSSHLRTGLCW